MYSLRQNFLSFCLLPTRSFKFISVGHFMFGSSHLMSTETLAETPNRKWMNYKIQCSLVYRFFLHCWILWVFIVLGILCFTLKFLHRKISIANLKVLFNLAHEFWNWYIISLHSKEEFRGYSKLWRTGL